MKPFRALFRAEALVNIFSGTFALVLPAAFTALFTTTPLPNSELARWFGALLVAFGYVMWRALDRNWDTLEIVLQAYLLGDILFFIALLYFVSNSGAWTAPTMIIALLTVILAACRVICLLRPDLLGRQRGQAVLRG